MKWTTLTLLTFGFLSFSCTKKENTKDALNLLMTKDSLEIYKKLYEEAAYFSIDKNEHAQKQFAPRNIEDVMVKVVQDFSVYIKENGETVLPVDKNGVICKVNKLSVINNQWLIFDFYGEGVTGEILMKYHYTPDNVTKFNNLDIVIY